MSREQAKAAAIMEFVDLMIGAFESNHVTTNTLTLAQLHRIAEIHVKDSFGINYGNIVDRHGEELAKECGLSNNLQTSGACTCEVDIDFIPSEVTQADECYPAFKAGGLVLKFWLLFKKNHITTQHFRTSLEKLTAHLSQFVDSENDSQPFNDIYEFRELLGNVGIRVDEDWLIQHWDYFNPNIQKKVSLKYKEMVEVNKVLIIN